MLKIITLGDERLKKHSILVPDFDGELKKLVEQMFETLLENRGVGLAAAQVGKNVRLFVIHLEGDSPRVFANPELLETSVEMGIVEEGCLSLPGINAEVLRPAAVRIQAWNERGKPFSLDAEGMLARVIQHELDHLNGVLFIDRLDPKKKERLLKQYQQSNVAG